MADDIGAAVIARLKADANLTKETGQRIYPDVLKDGCKLPCVVVIVDLDLPAGHMTGETAVAEALVEVTSYADDRPKANEVDKLARKALKTVTGYTAADTKVKEMWPGFRLWEYERPLAGESVGRQLSRRDYRTHYVYEAT